MSTEQGAEDVGREKVCSFVDSVTRMQIQVNYEG